MKFDMPFTVGGKMLEQIALSGMRKGKVTWKRGRFKIVFSLETHWVIYNPLPPPKMGVQTNNYRIARKMCVAVDHLME